MKEYFIRLSLLLKRQFTNKIYIFLLVAMPLCILLTLFFISESNSSNSVPVGFYIAEQNENFSEILRGSLKEISGRLEFVEYEDKEKMINDTSSSALECSYIFTEDLFEGLQNDDYKNTILAFTSPSTVVSDMVDEMVFTAVFRAFGDSVLYAYADNNPDIFKGLDNTELKIALRDAYNEQLKSGHTFSLDFKVFEDSSTSADAPNIDSDHIPVHGIVAVFLFLCLLLACSDYCMESERGTFNMLSPKKQIVLSSCFIESWLLPAVISSATALIITAFYDNLGNNADFSSCIRIVVYEFFAIFIYCILLTLFGLFLNCIIKKSLLISALIPVLITGSLIFCPIIINLSAILPIARVVEKLFLPYYYLIFF